MNDAYRPLSPDDVQQENIDLLSDEKAVGQPYGVTSLFIGMAVLLIIRGLLRDAPMPAMLWGWSIALTAALFAYSTFVVLRPKIHLVALCIAGAELGMLYGLPVAALYIATWQDISHLAPLIRWLVLAGITGLLCARGFKVEENPQPVMLLSMLLAFVMVSLRFLVLPRW
ncbi:MAG: hypothetical protein ACYC7E_23265 [Armatimonadota bacterium]